MDNKSKPPSRRDMEKLMANFHKTLAEKDFKNEEELRAFLDSMVGKPLPEALPSKNAKDYAQDIIYDAWDSTSHKERVKLAHEALASDPDCVDAYVILAENDAKTYDEQRMYYEKAVFAGERSLGKKFFKENKGHFWGLHSTRPYMRARAGLSQCLWEMGEIDEAIRCCRKTLELNLNDNMGMRYVLGGYLVSLGRFDEVADLMDHYEDSMTFFIYTRLLLTLKDEKFDEAKETLKVALERNQFVPDYLTGRKNIYRFTGEAVTVGGDDEADCYAEEYIKGWRLVPGAIQWLRENTVSLGQNKVGRNEPCPCGSGKKFKKCCGANVN